MKDERAFGEKVDYVLYDRATKRADGVYDKKMERRRMKDFVDDEPYNQEAIDRIEAQVNGVEELFQQELDRLPEDVRQKVERAKMLADTLEGIILNVKSWFGPTSNIYPTTRYDDYFNGVDLVAERTQGGASNHNGFALDITYAGYNAIHKKINRIVERLKKGEMGRVAFFKSNDGRYKGQLNQIPLVVIGVDGNTMRGLVNMFAENQDEDIENHQVQFQITEQVLMQCDFFIKLAETLEDKNLGKIIKDAYTNLSREFTMIDNLKFRLGNKDKQERDSFHENLKKVLDNLDNTDTLQE